MALAKHWAMSSRAVYGCGAYSQPHDQAFWEMAPAPPQYLWNVSPGDYISSFTYVTLLNHYLLNVADATHSHHTVVNRYAQVPNISAESIVEKPSSLVGGRGPQFLAKYRGSVDFIADSRLQPLPGNTQERAPYWGDTPWTIAHKMTLMRGRMVLAQPGNASNYFGNSRFSVTARAS